MNLARYNYTFVYLHTLTPCSHILLTSISRIEYKSLNLNNNNHNNKMFSATQGSRGSKIIIIIVIVNEELRRHGLPYKIDLVQITGSVSMSILYLKRQTSRSSKIFKSSKELLLLLWQLKCFL